MRIFGPPGTGKTTTLLDIVDKSLSAGVPSQQMAFLHLHARLLTKPRKGLVSGSGLTLVLIYRISGQCTVWLFT